MAAASRRVSPHMGMIAGRVQRPTSCPRARDRRFFRAGSPGVSRSIAAGLVLLMSIASTSVPRLGSRTADAGRRPRGQPHRRLPCCRHRPPSRAMLERALKASGVTVEIANAGVSGDTAAQGLARLDWSVPDGTDAVIVELGANDALRGLDPAGTRQGARRDRDAAEGARHRGDAGRHVRAPQSRRGLHPLFDSIYPDLAAKYGVPLYPFFLDGIVGDPKYQSVRSHASQSRGRAHHGLPHPARRAGLPRQPGQERLNPGRRRNPSRRLTSKQAADRRFSAPTSPCRVGIGQPCCACRAPGLSYSPSQAARCML